MLTGDYSDGCFRNVKPCGCRRCREDAEKCARAANRAVFQAKLAQLGLNRLRLKLQENESEIPSE